MLQDSSLISSFSTCRECSALHKSFLLLRNWCSGMQCSVIVILLHSCSEVHLSFQMLAVELHLKFPMLILQALNRRGICLVTECGMNVRAIFKCWVENTSLVQMENGHSHQLAEVGICAFILAASTEGPVCLPKHSKDFTFFDFCFLCVPNFVLAIPSLNSTLI